jgi:hypothetical protein
MVPSMETMAPTSIFELRRTARFQFDMFPRSEHAATRAETGAIKTRRHKRDAVQTQISGSQMQTMVKTLIVGAILAIATSAASAADSVVGTWNLNVAKSTFSPGPPLKSQIRTYAESADGIVLTLKTVAADGNTMANPTP